MTYSGLIMTLEKSRVQIQVRGLGGGTRRWWHQVVARDGGGTGWWHNRFRGGTVTGPGWTGGMFVSKVTTLGPHVTLRLTAGRNLGGYIQAVGCSFGCSVVHMQRFPDSP